MKSAFVVLVLALAAGGAAAQSKSDLAREQRWADQVVPGLVVGEAVTLQLDDGTRFLGLYAPAEKARGAVLLLHDAGRHPDFAMIGELRVHLADRGYSTLALQMPVSKFEEESPKAYIALFPEADRRIAAGLQFLRDKGASRIALVTHYWGTMMARSFLRRHLRDAPVAAWVALSINGRLDGLDQAPFAIFDLYGDKDFNDVRGNAGVRRGVLERIPGSRQMVAADGGRRLAGGEKTVLQEVPVFLDSVFK